MRSLMRSVTRNLARFALRSLFQSPRKIRKIREIWAAGGMVYMVEVGGMAREEAKLAEGAVIDAFGERYF